MIRRVRYYIFLRDVFLLSITAFGGPQGHIAMFLDILVKKRGYLSEKDLIELNALCQILPGPTSTQTITALGFKVGGPNLAYLTLLVWMMPAFVIMTSAGIATNYLGDQQISLSFTKFIQPMAVGIVAYSAFVITKKIIDTATAKILLVLAIVLSAFIVNPFLYPIMIVAGGLVTGLKYKKQDVEEKSRIKINWSNFILWIVVLLFAATLGGLTDYLPVRLFENFYRTGSLIFGGGQVLVPFLFTEFVEYKDYLSSPEFLSGYALVQALPGPVFSFCAYVGALSMREFGVGGELLGAFMATAGIFLPGTFLIFFVSRFWEDLKKYRFIKASLEGINAVSCGMVVAAAFLLARPIEVSILNYGIILGTLAILLFTKIRAPWIIATGLLLGFLI
ncbi:MAG: chromate efflux transporter [Cyclobacteriaceae bacterium]